MFGLSSLVTKLIIGGIIFVAVAGYILFLRLENAELSADLIAAQRDAAIYQEVNKRTAESFRQYVEQTQITQRALAESAAGARELATAVDKAVMEVRDAPDEWNRKASDIRYVTFERLRMLEQTAPTPGNPSRDSNGGTTTGTDGVPAIP